MILVGSLVVLVAAAAVAPLLTRAFGRNAGYVLAGLFLVALGLVLTQATAALDEPVAVDLPWLPTLDVGLRLRMDGLALLFATLILGVGALILSYSARYLSPSRDHGRLYVLLTLFAASMLGLVLANDVVLLYVFWELTTLCSFFLIGANGLRGARPATRALVITAGGGLALLAAVLLVVSVVGTTELSVIIDERAQIQQSPLGPWIAALLIIAAFTKSAQVPVHFWLPDAMVAITPVSAYLHAATLVKSGIYLLMRFSPVFAGASGWTVVLVSVGLTSAIFGAVVALKQHDLKALLAYSTVSQLGWIISLIGVGTTSGLAVAALHTFAHALFKATLFMLVGIIDREAGSRDVRELSGLYRAMPVTATLTGLAAMSMAGLPPFLGFVSKEEAYYAYTELDGATGWLVGAVAVVAAAMTFAYGAKIVNGAFAGPLRQRKLYEPSWLFLAPASVPAVLGLVLGVAVTALNPLVNRTVEDTLRRAGDADLALWHGFTAPLWLSVITIALGVTLFLAREPIDRFLHRTHAPVTGAQAYERLYDGALAVGDAVGRPARSGSLAAHLVHPIWVLVAVAGAGVLLLGPVGPLPASTTQPGDWLVVGLLAAGVLATALARSRLAAIALLGAVGLTVAGWFLLLGAPDVALTQVLVEILTVLVAILVLRRLPRAFAGGGRVRAATAGAVAVTAGAAAFVATLALTGRRDQSEVGERLLSEGPELSGGTNVVNTVLVDFRGLDTLGEATVLAMVALGLLALLRADRADRAAGPVAPIRLAGHGRDAGDDRAASPVGSATVLRVTAHLVTPLVVALSLFLLYRGHNDPGGGFIAALVAGAGVALTQLSVPPGRRARLRGRPLVAAGLAVGVGAGLLGLLDGSFLRPLRDSLSIGGLSQSLTTSLIFDVGVYLCVLGLLVVAVDRLGRGRSLHEPEPEGAAAGPPPAEPPPGPGTTPGGDGGPDGTGTRREPAREPADGQRDEHAEVGA